MKLSRTLIAGRDMKSELQEIAAKQNSDFERPVENHVINLYPQVQYQTVVGFGGAMTEAAAWSLHQLSEEKRSEALREYFGECGAGYTVVRTHIDSCDFSLGMYQAVEDVEKDPDLLTFSIKRDRQYIIPALKEAMEISGRPLSVLLSPWSPPAEWKTESMMLKSIESVDDIRKAFPPELSDAEIAEASPMAAAMMKAKESAPTDGSGTRVCGGHLKPVYYGKWAAYLVKYVQAYLEEGIPVKWISVQNEAQAATPWDSCEWTSEEEKTFLEKFLYPELEKAGLAGKVGIIFWDHNKENLVGRAFEVLDESTEKMVTGVGFHWYSGDHFEAVQIVHDLHPSLRMMFTEGCCEFAADDANAHLDHAMRYAHDMIGNLNAGMDTWFDWNMFLDEKGGPNHVGNFCSAPVMLDGKGGYQKNPSFEYIRLIGSSIEPGAVRIGCTKYTDRLDVTAFRNPDGSIVCVILNRGEEDLPVNVRIDGTIGQTCAEALSLSVVRIDNN